MDLDKFELSKHAPNTEAFLSDPLLIAQEIRNALISGVLSPVFAEKHLASIMEIVRTSHIPLGKSATDKQIELDQFRNALVTMLNTTDGSRGQVIAALNTFASERKLDLMPKKGMAVESKEDYFTPDWVSNDEQHAVSLSKGAVWFYSKINNLWVPEPPTL